MKADTIAWALKLEGVGGGGQWLLREGEGAGIRAVRRSACVWGVTSL